MWPDRGHSKSLPSSSHVRDRQLCPTDATPRTQPQDSLQTAEATSVGEKRVGWADPPGKAFGMAPGGYPRGQEQRPHEQETLTFLLGQQDILL